MNKLTYKIKVWYHLLTNSIGFYPTLISAIFFFIGSGMILLESSGDTRFFIKNFPLVMISSSDTARLILSTIAGGVISLTVFSFTMVMIVFNQAATNYSPRIIPGLISKKSHQIVLGFYVGTLIYCLLVMINIDSKHFGISLPAFSVFIGECFGIICLVLFVYFIHSISNSIQIGNILQGIYKQTIDGLKREEAENKNPDESGFDARESWKVLNSPQSGYLQRIEQNKILDILDKNNCRMEITIPLGTFILENFPMARISHEVEDKVLEQILSNFIFFEEEIVGENYYFGFKQITETAVKALSPGINDPGTAIKAIDYLTDLITMKLKLEEKRFLYHDKKPMILLCNPSNENLIYFCYAPIREYGKSDVIIITKLLNSMREIILSTDSTKFEKLILDEVVILIEDSDKNLNNKADRKKINILIDEINHTSKQKTELKKLAI